jgi:hypothetical protein
VHHQLENQLGVPAQHHVPPLAQDDLRRAATHRLRAHDTASQRIRTATLEHTDRSQQTRAPKCHGPIRRNSASLGNWQKPRVDHGSPQTRQCNMAKSFSIIDYGKRLEGVLLAQREVSSIIGHPGEVGAAREFFVESVLKRFLPRDVVIGRGEIVDGGGGRSRQQDLLLYRSNFPIIDSLAGAHLYLAEGVLATIEVKSSLDDQGIRQATENIASVRELTLSYVGLGEPPHVEGAPVGLEAVSRAAAANRIMAESEPLPRQEPELKVADERIWTYVFGFAGVEHDTLTKDAAKHAWPKGQGPDCLCVLGKAFGATTDMPISPARPPSGPAFHIKETSEPLGWWLANLLWVLRRRPRVPVLRPYLSVDEA